MEFGIRWWHSGLRLWFATAVEWILSLDWELPHAKVEAKNEKKKENVGLNFPITYDQLEK